MTEDNSIFIGNKPFMNYVTGVVMQFTTQEVNEVIVKARGKFISRAVDVAEVASKRFLTGQIAVKDINISSDAFRNNEGKDVRVSTIDITLHKIPNAALEAAQESMQPVPEEEEHSQFFQE